MADSPSTTLHVLGQILFRTGGAAGAGVALAAGVEPSWSVAGWAVGGLLFANLYWNVIAPVTKSVGRGLAHKIDVLMETPPEQRPSPTPEASPSPEQQDVES